jgi:PilZ domain
MPASDTLPRNLRTAERFLVFPPLEGRFAATDVLIHDLSVRGARFLHRTPLESGSKAVMAVKGASPALSLEAVIVWTQHDPPFERYVSGARTYVDTDRISALLADLQRKNRCSRIEELRSADRFLLKPLVEARFGHRPAALQDLSARGARIQIDSETAVGETGTLQFSVPESALSVEVTATVVWKRLQSIVSPDCNRYWAGLSVSQHPELMRLAIGRFYELNQASLDTHSLHLKLKIMRARARQQAPRFRDENLSGVPDEQFLLVEGVREELRLNPEEAMYWYRKARLAISNPAARAVAPAIADHPDALAVWEYLDRSIDPSMIGRTFEWTGRSKTR